MSRFRSGWIPPIVAACVILATGPARGQSAAGAGAGKKAAAPPAEYAGAEACAGCHEDISKAFAKNPHFSLDKKKRWSGKACEACHGPGAKHADSTSADDIVNPLRLTASKADAICLSCHRNQPTQVGRLESGHARSAIACTSCHDMHKPGAESSFARLKRNDRITQLCSGCHRDIAAAFLKPHHHKVPEGAMTCTSCHNPHASFMSRNLRMASTGAEPGCLNCHSDKRGPFVYDHAPVRNEPCTTCHEPHGSVNPRMLTRQEVYIVCLECHSNLGVPASNSGTLGSTPPSFHNMAVPRYRNCTTCHVKVHGSNADRGLLR
jgi:DmsE family decaheme c-type cytochrome